MAASALSPLRLFAAAVACTTLFALAPAGAHAAATLHVDVNSAADPASCGSYAAPCATLGQALAHAVGGETIHLSAGTYPGATVDVPVTLVGSGRFSTGPARGFNAAASTRIMGTIMARATLQVDGIDFVAPGAPAISFDAPAGASRIDDSTFDVTGATSAILVDAPLAGLQVRSSLLRGGTGATGVRILGDAHGGVPNVAVSASEFSGFGIAAVDASGTPGIQLVDSTATGVGSLLRLSNSAGGARALVARTRVTAATGSAIAIGAGVQGLDIERNVITGAAGAAILLDGAFGTGTSADLLVRANDITAVAHAANARTGSLGGTLRMRGNRLVDVRRGGAAIASAAAGTIDARGNWWGLSSGLDAGAFVGPRIDATDTLRLVGVEAPAAVLVGGSGTLAARLAGPADAVQEASSIGLHVAFSSSSAAVDATSVLLRTGRAETFFTGTTPGTTNHAAALDFERVTASTRVLASGVTDDAPAEPSVAEVRVPVIPYRARTRMVGRSYARSLTSGIKQWVATNRHASVRTTYLISHYDAHRLGLRARANRTHNPFVIARVRTRAIRGTRIVTAPINPRPAWAIRRYGQRLAVYQVSVIRTSDGQVRRSHRRIVLPAMVR